MIKLERNFHPLCLCPAESKRLTNEYKLTKKSVWNFDLLKNALLDTSNGKCAYCECDLTKESKYMEVEHFLNKDGYPNDVANWENLLPSCKRCNGSKSSHDVTTNPIVNPYADFPPDHFKLQLYRLKAKTTVGQETIDVLDLNNRDRAVVVRFDIGESIQESIACAIHLLQTYKENRATRTRNRLLGTTEALLFECQPSSEYSATAASVLHGDTLYLTLIDEMKKLGLWSAELENLHVNSMVIRLEIT